MTTEFPIVIIGAGPAGLFAAMAAAGAGARVVVVEQLDRVGVKLLATGGGRCNVTNVCEAGAFMGRLGRQGRFLQDALADMDSRGVVELLASLDVPTVAEGHRVYPASHSAQTVQRALERRARELGVAFRFQTVVTDVSPPTDSRPFVLTLSRDGREEMLAARAVIVATGGRSYAKLGGTGGGYELARRLGHTVTELTPALVGLVTREDWVRTQAGVSLPARVAILGKGANKAGVRGDILFTHHGLSGPAVLDISGDVAWRLTEQKEVPLAVDVTNPPGGVGQASHSFPSPAENHAFWLGEFSRWQSGDGVKAVTTMLARHLPARLTNVVCGLSGVEPSTPCAHLPGDARRRLAGTLTGLPLTAVATDGWEKAMVTRGGVSLKQIDPRTLGSRLVNGLYFAGEVLDLDGPSGGFNLQIAFTTGHRAGLSAAG